MVDKKKLSILKVEMFWLQASKIWYRLYYPLDGWKSSWLWIKKAKNWLEFKSWLRTWNKWKSL